MKRNSWKLLVDVVMIILFLMMYKKRIISICFHEIVGLLVFAIVLIHLFFNRKLFIASVKKFNKIKTKTKLRYLVDVVLLVDFVLVVITGILISKVLFSFGYCGIWKFTHNFLAAFALILVGIHIGLEWDTFYAMVRKVITLPKNPSKPVIIVISLLILVGGAFSMTNTSFADWLSGPFTYDYHDSHGNKSGLGKDNGNDGQHLNGTDQGKHNGHGKGFQKNQNKTGRGLGNNGTPQYKNQNQKDNDPNLVNGNKLTYDNNLDCGNIDYIAIIINIVEIGLIIGFFGIITRFVIKLLKF